jgi:hypothetical protein
MVILVGMAAQANNGETLEPLSRIATATLKNHNVLLHLIFKDSWTSQSPDEKLFLSPCPSQILERYRPSYWLFAESSHRYLGSRAMRADHADMQNGRGHARLLARKCLMSTPAFYRGNIAIFEY